MSHLNYSLNGNQFTNRMIYYGGMLQLLSSMSDNNFGVGNEAYYKLYSPDTVYMNELKFIVHPQNYTYFNSRKSSLYRDKLKYSTSKVKNSKTAKSYIRKNGNIQQPNFYTSITRYVPCTHYK